jgi:hypothetical protein
VELVQVAKSAWILLRRGDKKPLIRFSGLQRVLRGTSATELEPGSGAKGYGKKLSVDSEPLNGRSTPGLGVAFDDDAA